MFALRLLAVAVILSLLAVACSGGDNGAPKQPVSTPLSVEAWALRFCGISEVLHQRVQDGIGIVTRKYGDPAVLPLEDRKARAAEYSTLFVVALDEAAAGFKALEPPTDTREFNAATAQALERQSADIRTGLQAVAVATDLTAVEAANAQFAAAQERNRVANAAAARVLPAESLAALRAIQRCGAVNS